MNKKIRVPVFNIRSTFSLAIPSSPCHQALEQLRCAISLFMRVIFPKTGTHFWVIRSRWIANIFVGALGVGLWSVAFQPTITNAAEIYQPTAVVEMFTSQGCSSCPPADRYVNRLAGEKRVLALAWHVDYWDYIGWSDTFASKEFTSRQYAYAAALGERGVYTPQAIINGRDHAVGSHGGSIEDLIAAYHNTDNGLTVLVNAEVADDVLQIRVGAGATKQNATLWMIYFDRSNEVDIKHGENAGKTFVYSNIVREVEMVAMMKEGGINVDLPVSEMARKGHNSCALVLQKRTPEGNPGPIIGATMIENLSS